MKKRKVQIVDLGSGNLRSLIESFKKIGLESIVLKNPEEIVEEISIVIPGVGFFGTVANKASQSGFVKEIRKRSSRQKILGICLGMQLLLDESEEGDSKDGFGLISGKVMKLHSDSIDWRIPNVGWRNVYVPENIESKLNSVLSDKAFYHIHSYFASPFNPDDIKAYSVFGELHIPVVIAHKNVLGVQFHPEKSQDAGLDFLTAWNEIDPTNN